MKGKVLSTNTIVRRASRRVGAESLAVRFDAEIEDSEVEQEEESDTEQEGDEEAIPEPPSPVNASHQYYGSKRLPEQPVKKPRLNSRQDTSHIQRKRSRTRESQTHSDDDDDICSKSSSQISRNRTTPIPSSCDIGEVSSPSLARLSPSSSGKTDNVVRGGHQIVDQYQGPPCIYQMVNHGGSNTPCIYAVFDPFMSLKCEPGRLPDNTTFTAQLQLDMHGRWCVYITTIGEGKRGAGWMSQGGDEFVRQLLATEHTIFVNINWQTRQLVPDRGSLYQGTCEWAAYCKGSNIGGRVGSGNRPPVGRQLTIENLGDGRPASMDPSEQHNNGHPSVAQQSAGFVFTSIPKDSSEGPASSIMDEIFARMSEERRLEEEYRNRTPSDLRDDISEVGTENNPVETGIDVD